MIADRFVLQTSYEELEIRAADGRIVRAICVEPPALDAAESAAPEPRASVLVVPQSRAFAAELARTGLRVLTFDGESDVALVAECVRARADGHPIIAVGPPPILAADADAYVLTAGKLLRSMRYARDWLQTARDAKQPIATVGVGAAFALLAGRETTPFVPAELTTAVEWALAATEPSPK